MQRLTPRLVSGAAAVTAAAALALAGCSSEPSPRSAAEDTADGGSAQAGSGYIVGLGDS
ncbi:MAG: hypothetical protein KDC39_15760 [Actinobacteria bacterium]|nr:hypothetical protein [Actinomycetota bacterium]